jgi:hypothetical protein
MVRNKKDAARYVPNDVGFITWAEYDARLERLRSRYGRQVPIKIDKTLAISEEGRPIVHIAIGEGQNHHLRIDGVHPNEPLCLLSSVYEAEYYCHNPKLLRDQQLTIDIVCADPDGLVANERWITERRPDLLAYTLGYFRIQDPRHQVEWSFPIEFDGHSWNEPSIGTKVVLALEAKIRACPGHQIRSLRSGHNIHLGNGVYFKAAGPKIESLESLLKASANRNHIPLEYGPVEAVYGSQEWTGFYEYATLKSRWDWFGGRGVNSGASAYEYLSTKHPNLVGIYAEIPMFIATRIDSSLHNLSARETQLKKEAVLGDLPRMIGQAGEIATRLPPSDPLVVAAMGAAGKVGLGSASSGETLTEDPSRSLLPDEAFISVGTGTFYQACRAGLLIRMLQAYGQDEQLQTQMGNEVHRIVRIVEQLGAVQRISLAAATRLQIATAMLALDHSLGLSQKSATGKSQGLITDFRAKIAERKAARTRRQARLKN